MRANRAEVKTVDYRYGIGVGVLVERIRGLYSPGGTTGVERAAVGRGLEKRGGVQDPPRRTKGVGMGPQGGTIKEGMLFRGCNK